MTATAYLTGFGSYLPGEPVDNDGIVARLGGDDPVTQRIRRRVLEAIPSPIWEISKYRKDLQSTDLIFCEKVRESGFQIWADLDLRVGHMIVAPVFPEKKNGQWRTLLLQRGNIAIGLPAASPPLRPDQVTSREVAPADFLK